MAARCLAATVPALAALCLAAAAPAVARTHAISARQANRIVLKRLGPLARLRTVIVFRSRRPLRPGTRVGAADGGHTVRLRRSAWLYWADLRPTADLDHPSALILLDARTGHVIRAGRLLRWPLVNGRLPGFLRSFRAYRSARDHVLVRGRRRGRRALRLRVQRSLFSAAPGQCVVVVGGSEADAGDWNWGEHTADARAFTRFARENLGITRIYAAGSLGQLRDRVGVAQQSGCAKITIFMTGEGSAPPGWIDPVTGLGPYPGNPRPNIQLGPDNRRIYGPDLAKLLRDARSSPPPGRPAPVFTLIIQGCFSGRMTGELKGTPGVSAVITSSAPRTESNRETNLDKLLSGPRPSPFVVDLMGEILDKMPDTGGDLGQAAQAGFLDLPPSADEPEMEVSGQIITKGPLAVARCTGFHMAGCVDFHGGIYSGGDHRGVAAGSLEIRTTPIGYCEQPGCEFTDCYVCPHLDTAFPKGATVTAVATPAKGSVFGRWGHGACAGQGATCTFTATKPSCITAQFLLANPTAPPQSLPDVACEEDRGS